MNRFQSLFVKIAFFSKSFFLRSHKAIFYASLSLVPLCLFLATYIVYKLQIQLTPKKDPFPIIKTSQYPLLERTFAPVITAQAAYIMDNNSKVVLFAKNDTIRFSPASTTKMMTALVSIDYYKMNDLLTIKRRNVEPVVVGFPYGVKVTYQNMLYGMLLPSGNDAAFAIGDNYPGGEAGFVAAMNKRAQLMHLENTHYGDPVGLADDEDYTTVRDMAILASYVVDHPILSKLVATKQYTISDSTGAIYYLKNLNQLLGMYGVNGVKTGYTGEAGEVLATSAVIHNHTFIIIVMKSENRFADTIKLLQLLENNVSFVSIRP